MFFEEKYSICWVETPVKPEKCGDKFNKSAHHSFLALCREAENRPIILEELHFLATPSQERLTLQGLTKQGIPRNIEELEVFTYLAGEKDYIIEKWQEIIMSSVDINALSLDFQTTSSPDAYNCRAGARAALELSGFSFNSDFPLHSQSGTQAHITDLVRAL